MLRRHFVALTVTALALSMGGLAMGAPPPTTWDQLVQVKSKRFDLVYLLPGADFRGYTKVMIDPAQVAFRKNWMRDYNDTTMDLSSRIRSSDLQKVIDEAAKGMTEILDEGFAKGGYPVVAAPGPDVLRVSAGVINVSVNAPENRSAGRTRTFAQEAGSGTLVVEFRDSESRAVLARVIDSRVAGDTTVLMRNSVSNRADFRNMAREWVERSVESLNEAKSLSPINTAGRTVKAK